MPPPSPPAAPSVQARARLALPPPQQLVLPLVALPGQKRPRSPSTLSAAQSLRKLARSAPSEGGTPVAEGGPPVPREDSDGTDTSDEDWGSSIKAMHHARRLAADASTSGVSMGGYDGADVIADVMPLTEVKPTHTTRTHHVRACCAPPRLPDAAP